MRDAREKKKRKKNTERRETFKTLKHLLHVEGENKNVQTKMVKRRGVLTGDIRT